MAHNAYVRAGAVWNTGLVVTHGEFRLFDLAQFASINGDAGGTWAPSSLIIVGGSGMQVVLAGTSTLASGASLTTATSAAVQIGGTFVTAVGSVSTFNGTAIFDGTTAFNGSTSFSSNANFVGPWGGTGALLVSGTATFSANPAFTGNPVFSGFPSVASGAQLTIGSGATLTIAAGGTQSVLGKIVLSSAGQIIWRVLGGVDADHTYSVSTCDIVLIADGDISANHVYTIDSVGAVLGSQISLRKDTGGFDITLRRADATLIGKLTVTPGTGYRWVDLVFGIGGKWEVARFQVA
jgi:hypothetical protein